MKLTVQCFNCKENIANCEHDGELAIANCPRCNADPRMGDVYIAFDSKGGVYPINSADIVYGTITLPPVLCPCCGHDQNKPYVAPPVDVPPVTDDSPEPQKKKSITNKVKDKFKKKGK